MMAIFLIHLVSIGKRKKNYFILKGIKNIVNFLYLV